MASWSLGYLEHIKIVCVGVCDRNIPYFDCFNDNEYICLSIVSYGPKYLTKCFGGWEDGSVWTVFAFISMGLITRTYVHSWMWWHTFIIPELEGWRKAEFWNLLANQPRLLGELQANESLFQNTMGSIPELWHMKLSSVLHLHMYKSSYGPAWTTHVCMHIHTTSASISCKLCPSKV